MASSPELSPQGAIFVEDAVLVVAEEIAAHSAAGFLIGFERDELHPAVGGGDAALRQRIAGGAARISRTVSWASKSSVTVKVIRHSSVVLPAR